MLPECQHKVRYYGWLHPNARLRLLRVQTLLEVPILLTHPAPADPPLHLCCPQCGAFALVRIGRLPRPRPP